MPVSICPRCNHVNPEYAAFCHFDGVVLQAHQSVSTLGLPAEFVFPSGRRCRSFDELAQGCQEEWAQARDLLIRGVFAQFFRAGNRDDLVRAANDAKAHPNPDIGLTTFLVALPGTRTQTPKLDLNPRRILLGELPAGATKTVPLTITNQGQAVLHGTVTVVEGQDWLSLSEAGPVHEIDVAAVREQVVQLTISTKGIAAGQTYGAKLSVLTNGGVVEVPLRMDLVAQPFPKAPFQGVQTQRELADKMRQHPKAAVPMLQSGEVERWYKQNAWTFPVQGPPVKGVGGVQQFFEGMGLSKPPPVLLSQSQMRFTCKHKDVVRGQVTLQTNVKKWVYAQVKSDAPWLKPLEAQVAGPQHALVAFEIDTRHWTSGPTAEGELKFEANGGQKLTLNVIVDVQGLPMAPSPRASAPASPPNVTGSTLSAPAPNFAPTVPEAPTSTTPGQGVKFIPALMTTLLACLILRVLLVPLVDCAIRPAAVRAAAGKLGIRAVADSPITHTGGWLQLPWLSILIGGDGKFSARDFQPDKTDELRILDFRHYFVSCFIRWFVLGTFWIGAFAGGFAVVKRGGTIGDVPWGVISGTVVVLCGSATLAAVFLVGELVPHTIWHLAIGTQAGFAYLLLWIILAIVSWFIIGLVLGIVVPWIGPLRRLLVDPLQAIFAGALRVLGMRTLADYWAP